MLKRLLFALVAALFVVAGCSDDSSSSDGEAPADDSSDGSASDDSSGGDDSAAGDDSVAGDDSDDSGTDDGGTPPDALEIDPVGVTDQINTMIEQAAADGEVTGEEIGEILEVSGTPESQADCEADLLAELGVTDPTDPEQLVEAVTIMTEDQRIALSVCLGGG